MVGNGGGVGGVRGDGGGEGDGREKLKKLGLAPNENCITSMRRKNGWEAVLHVCNRRRGGGKRWRSKE